LAHALLLPASVSGNVITGASTKPPASARESKPPAAPPQPTDDSSPAAPNRFHAEFARDPWGRVMITTPLRVPTWVPREIRDAIERGFLPDGITHFTRENGREGVVYSKRSDGLQIHELFTYLPEDEATYLAITRGNEDAARRLAQSAAQWNREMRHFVENLGMPPSEAMAEIRRIDAAVLKDVIFAAALLLSSGVVLGTVKKIPQLPSPKAYARPSAPEAPATPPPPKRTPKPGVSRATRTIGSGDRAMTLTPIQLQAKFKHAAKFGVTGNYNKKNVEAFVAALQTHLGDPDTIIIQGTYRGDCVTHFYNPKTQLNVIRNPQGEFVSGFRLNDEQAMNVSTRGSL
jgi:hypothetical protein